MTSFIRKSVGDGSILCSVNESSRSHTYIYVHIYARAILFGEQMARKILQTTLSGWVGERGRYYYNPRKRQ